MSENHPVTKSLWQCLRDWEAGLTAADRRNQRRFVLALMAWALSLVGALAVLEQGWVTGGPATAVALVPLAIGVVALLAYLRFITRADEMTRRIQLEGLAIGFGAGAVFTLGYPVLEMAGWPELSKTMPAAVLLAGWGIGQLVAVRRYL